MLRRDVMKLIGGAAAGVLPVFAGTAFGGNGVENERIVILGGGFAALAFIFFLVALYIRSLR